MTDEAKEARRAYQRQWRAKNKAEILAYQKKWRSENPDKVKEYQERYWENKIERMHKEEN